MEEIIPISCSSGNQYLLKLSPFNGIEDYEFPIPIIDLTLALVSDTNRFLEISDILLIAKHVLGFIEDNDVVVYYYCDRSEIKRSKRHLQQTPQEYRHELFGKIYELLSKGRVFHKQDVVIFDDTQSSAHYISLIAKDCHRTACTQISSEINMLADK